MESPNMRVCEQSTTSYELPIRNKNILTSIFVKVPVPQFTVESYFPAFASKNFISLARATCMSTLALMSNCDRLTTAHHPEVQLDRSALQHIRRVGAFVHETVNNKTRRQSELPIRKLKINLLELGQDADGSLRIKHAAFSTIARTVTNKINSP